MAGKWVDFKKIKETVKIEDVLVHYGLLDSLKQTPQGFKGPCPVHKGTNPNQFHVDTKKNYWNCFGDCAEKNFEGHVIGFVAAMEGVSLREAALLLADWFNITSEPATRCVPRRRRPSPPPAPASEKPSEPKKQEAVELDPENKELPFQLRSLSVDHPFFEERGILPDTIQHFGLGFCSKGLMKGRIVFPLHRFDGELIGYTGRTVQEVTADNPKWLLPPGLVKPKVLFNFHRSAYEFDTVIIVEGPTSLVAVYQAGFPNVVALLGKELIEDETLSYDQLRLITQTFSRAVLLLDGDEDGRKATAKIAVRLVPLMWVRAVTLPFDKDPSDLEPAALRQYLSF